MRLRTLVFREIVGRKTQFFAALASVAVGVLLVVSVRAVMEASQADVARKLDGLGANVLVLPPSVTVSDYFTADLSGAVFPESYVAQIALSDLRGLENVSPKLSMPIALAGRTVTLTGVLPQHEFAAKAAWKGAGVLGRPLAGECGPTSTFATPIQETEVRRRVITTLAPDEMLVGADVARQCGIAAGDRVPLGDRSFIALEILPETGTVDDTRLFAHLHTVQKMANVGAVVNAIEIVGCCHEIQKGLVEGLKTLLPTTRIVTVRQIVDTQLDTNRTMAALSWVLFALAIAVGCAGVLATMLVNLRSRRRELGALAALGGDGALFFSLFLTKSLVISLLGGLLGWIAGAALAVIAGPRWLGVHVEFHVDSLPMAVGLAVAVTTLAAVLPLWQVSRLDPADALRAEG